MKTLTVEYSKNISFVDADSKKVTIAIEIKDGSLSMSGNMGRSGGQIVDSIKPANDGQRELIELWKTFHLNDMHAGTMDQENALKSEDFEQYKVKISAVLDRAKKIESIINGSFENYCAFVGIPSSYSSARHDYKNLQKVWRGESELLQNSGYRTTKSVMELVKSIPKGMRPNFEWNSHVDPNKIGKLFSDSYTIQVEYLKSKNLLVDNGYTYGSAWLKRELPSDIIPKIENAIEAIGAESFKGSSYEKQANDLLAGMGVKFSAVYKDHAKYFTDDQESRDRYTCTFSRGKNKFSLRFGQSIANQGTPPTAYDVLACLTKNDPEDFGNFCDNYGYDQDSRQAMKIYKAVCKEWAKVNAFFSDVEIDQLREIA